MTGQERINLLRTVQPDVAIKVTRTLDPNFRWDGDGPDPVENGLDPYDVDVVAMAIHKGDILEGRSSLGGSYYAADEPIGEVHGYLPQMVKEALEELDAALAARM